MAAGLIPFDKRALGQRAALVGIDEAGRGCLAGPVVAAAVRCDRSFYESRQSRQAGRGVDDSKRLMPAQRAAVVERFKKICRENWIQIGIGTASVAEIEQYNIYQATVLAMRRAFQIVSGTDLDTGLEMLENSRPQAAVLIDGKPFRSFPFPHEGIVKGDQRSFAIALAGIHAKEWRDAHMREQDQASPGYGFSAHKGYGTPQHLEALRSLGPSVHHRKRFLRNFHAEKAELLTDRQDSLFQAKPFQ